VSRAYYAGPLWLYLLQANERFASNRGRTDALHAAFLADAAARCAECAPSASAPVVPKAAAVAPLRTEAAAAAEAAVAALPPGRANEGATLEPLNEAPARSRSRSDDLAALAQQVHE
tara:strand:- start:156 stop:506 length:351 start_codon:yes stop_codon:yes gene_type:complete